MLILQRYCGKSGLKFHFILVLVYLDLKIIIIVSLLVLIFGSKVDFWLDQVSIYLLTFV